MVTSCKDNQKTTITLTPNRSANWQQNKLLVYCVGFVTLSIAVVWSLLGAWLILPFAGLEIAMLWLVSYITCRNSYYKQILEIDEKKVRITSGLRYPIQEIHIDAQDISFICSESSHPMERPAIYLKTPNNKWRIGAFLNLSDLKTLRHQLIQAGVFEQSSTWWKV